MQIKTPILHKSYTKYYSKHSLAVLKRLVCTTNRNPNVNFENLKRLQRPNIKKLGGGRAKKV